MADFFGGKLFGKTGSGKDGQSDPYFEQSRVRSVEFITVPYDLKKKVGSGGLSRDILERAQAVIDTNATDFTPDAQRYLSAMREGIRIMQTQQRKFDADGLLATIAHPAMQLKANGAMFGYPMVTDVSALLIRFMEVVETIDSDTIELLNAFYTALNALIVGKIRASSEREAADLYDALDQACRRYFKRKNIGDDTALD